MGKPSFLATKLALTLALLTLLAVDNNQNNPPNNNQNTPPSPPPKPNPPLEFRSDEYDIHELPNMLPRFYHELTDLVSEPNFGSYPHRVLRFEDSDVYFDEYFFYLRLRSGTNQLTLLIRSFDLFVVGYIVGERVVLLEHQMRSIIDPLHFDNDNGIAMMGGIPMQELVGNRPLKNYGIHNPPRALANRAKCVLKLYHFTDFQPGHMGDTYYSLEAAARINREQLPINANGLTAAFDGLHGTINDVQANRVTIARSILYFTQFISESLRIKNVQNWVVANFANENALPIPRFILALEHGWGRAGYRLNNPRRSSPILSLGVSAIAPKFLSLEVMRNTFLITLRKTARPSREPLSMFEQYMDTVYVFEGTSQRRFRDSRSHRHRATSGASTSRQSGDGAGTSQSGDGAGTSQSGDGAGTSQSGDGGGTSQSGDGGGTSQSGDGGGTSQSGDGAGTSQSGDGAGPELGRWDKGKGVWRWN